MLPGPQLTPWRNRLRDSPPWQAVRWLTCPLSSRSLRRLSGSSSCWLED